MPLILSAMSQPMTLFVMLGIMTVLTLVSGILIYHSIFFPHTQHDHDPDK